MILAYFRAYHHVTDGFCKRTMPIIVFTADHLHVLALIVLVSLFGRLDGGALPLISTKLWRQTVTDSQKTRLLLRDLPLF